MTDEPPPGDVYGETRDLPGHGRAARESSDETLGLPLAGALSRASRPPDVLNPAALRPGDVFAGRYEIVSSVARGGFSFVFRALDRSDRSVVALKFLSSREAGADLETRMQRELRLARDLRHPNIVRVFDLVEAEGFLCLTMEFVEGKTLKELILARHPIPVEEAVTILGRLASAIAAVHAAGVVHRDLKPQNVIVAATGEVKLLDFGLARTPESTGLTVTGTILGTPEYMSPEQVDGKVADSRSDVYSLGVIGFELLAGAPPFRGDNALAVALQHVRARVPDVRSLRPETPEGIARLIFRMTDPSRTRRPRTAGEVLLEMDQRSRVIRRGPSKRRLALGGAAFVVLAAASASVFVLRGGRSAGEPADDPFRDGLVEVAVAVDPLAEGMGASAFPKALVDLVSSRLASPGTRVHTLSADELRQGARNPVSLRRHGVEQLLLVQIGRPRGEAAGEGSLSIGAVVRSTVDGSAWRDLPSRNVGAFDIEAVDAASQYLAREYLAALAADRKGRPPR